LHGDVTPEPTEATSLRLAMIAGLRR